MGEELEGVSVCPGDLFSVVAAVNRTVMDMGVAERADSKRSQPNSKNGVCHVSGVQRA